MKTSFVLIAILLTLPVFGQDNISLKSVKNCLATIELTKAPIYTKDFCKEIKIQKGKNLGSDKNMDAVFKVDPQRPYDEYELPTSINLEIYPLITDDEVIITLCVSLQDKSPYKNERFAAITTTSTTYELSKHNSGSWMYCELTLPNHIPSGYFSYQITEIKLEVSTKSNFRMWVSDIHLHYDN